MEENLIHGEENPSRSTPTRESHTEQAYRHRYGMLENAARLSYGISFEEQVDPRLVVVHTKDTVKSKNLGASTWRQYRAALRLVLQELGSEEAEEALRDLEAAQYRAERRADRITLTSARKMKGFPEKEFRIIKSYLEERIRSVWARPLINWMIAGMATGLRPVEWWGAELIEINPEEVGLPSSHGSLPALRVRNAKHTNQRAHGILRTVPLKHVTPEEMRAIIAHLRTVSQHDFQLAHKVCRQLLLRVCRVVLRNTAQMPTLYSCRHQFTADIKASGLSDEERGCLLGHSNGDTNNWHYGKMRSGRPRENILVALAELANVRQSLKRGRYSAPVPHERTE